MKLEFISCDTTFENGYLHTRITARPNIDNRELVWAFIGHNNLQILSWNTKYTVNYCVYEIVTSFSISEFQEKWNNFERDFPEYFL